VICPTGKSLHAIAISAGTSNPNSPARKLQFREPPQWDRYVQEPRAKINLFRFSEIHDCLAPSRLARGTLRPIVTKREAGCDGRFGLHETKASEKRTPKACGPGLPTLRSSFAKTFGKVTGAIKPGTPGRARHKPHNHRAGNAGCFGVPVVTCLRAFFTLHARLRVRKTPGFPCAL
jgi:hypothetical protein